jgi:hypothetical protein
LQYQEKCGGPESLSFLYPLKLETVSWLDSFQYYFFLLLVVFLLLLCTILNSILCTFASYGCVPVLSCGDYKPGKILGYLTASNERFDML